MNATQMSHEFDLLWNNIQSNQAPGMTEYEKSVFLTKAQDEIVKNYLVPQSQGNLVQTGVEGSPKREVDLGNLVVTVSADAVTAGDEVQLLARHPSKQAKLFWMPENMLAMLSESVTIDKVLEAGSSETAPSKQIIVVPISSIEFARILMKPYKYPLKDQCWRVTNAAGIREFGSGSDAYSVKTQSVMLIPPFGWEIASEEGSGSGSDSSDGYVITYVKLPVPILTANLSASASEALQFKRGGISYTQKTADDEFDTPDSLHEDIVQRAVELAKAAWSSSDNFVAMGRRTE